ncbi:hypothetical protein, unknown function [Leishmania tarentolae]|uniref:Uncharacterized protein n=1 Tax=Leishmania tarentolae TaxID=5689 RepID=A0A640KFN6_LEITA|nr:hypothetical protein, unknown function [Leishmania tarentolae]
MQPFQQQQYRCGRDFVLPGIPVLLSPEWSDEDEDANTMQAPPSVEAETPAPVACMANNSPALSPRVRESPKVHFTSPAFVQQAVPRPPGINQLRGDEAMQNKFGRFFRVNGKASSGFTAGYSGTSCHDTAARKQHTSFKDQPLECWPADSRERDDGDSPPHQIIGSFVSGRGRGDLPSEVGSLFVSSTHHFLCYRDDESSSTSSVSSSSSDTHRTRMSGGFPSSSSYYRQKRASMGPFSHRSTQVRGPTGGGGSAQQSLAQSYGIDAGPSVFVRAPQQNPSMMATTATGYSVLTMAASAAPSMFHTFHEDDVSCNMTDFRHDSTAEFHLNDVAVPSMRFNGAPVRGSNGGAPGALFYSRGGKTNATHASAADTHDKSSNHTIRRVSDDGGLKPGSLSNEHEDSFYTTVDNALYETHIHRLASHSPNAVVRVSTDAFCMPPINASQAISDTREPQHEHEGAPHRGNNTNEGMQGEPTVSVSWTMSASEKASKRPSGIHAAPTEYPLLPNIEMSSAEASVTTGKGTPASHRSVGDVKHQGDAQDGGDDSRIKECETGFLESANPKPDIALGRDVRESARDDEGSIYPSMACIKATQFSSVSFSLRTPQSSGKPNSKQLNFRSRITPRGHGATTTPVVGATVSNQVSAVHECRGTGWTASSLEAPRSGDLGATDSSANRPSDAYGGGGKPGPNAALMDWDDYGLLAWFIKSSLRTYLEPVTPFSMSSGVRDGGRSAAEELVKVTDSVTPHTISKRAMLAISRAAPPATTPTQGSSNNAISHLGESPHTAVTLAEKTAPLDPLHHDSSPSSGTTLAMPQDQQMLRTPPHLVATTAAVETESGLPRSPPTASLPPPTTCRKLSVTTGEVGGSTPAATAAPSSVSGVPHATTAGMNLRSAPSNALNHVDEYFLSGFHTDLTVSGPQGDEGKAIDKVQVPPLQNISSPAGAEGSIKGADQRCLISISAGRRQSHPAISSFHSAGLHRRSGGRSCLHIMMPSSSVSSSAPVSTNSTMSTALAWRRMEGAQGRAHATLKDDDEVLTACTDMTDPNGEGIGGFSTLDACAVLLAENHTPSLSLRQVTSRRSASEDLRETGYAESSCRRSELTSSARMEEVQVPRSKPKPSQCSCQASPLQR